MITGYTLPPQLGPLQDRPVRAGGAPGLSELHRDLLPRGTGREDPGPLPPPHQHPAEAAGVGRRPGATGDDTLRGTEERGGHPHQ